MQTPTTEIRSSVLFPVAQGTYFALALEDLAAPGKSYVAQVANDAEAAFTLARDVASRGHCRAHVIQFEIGPGGHITVAPGVPQTHTHGDK